MKTNKSFLVSLVAITALTLLTACGTLQQGRTNGKTVVPSGAVARQPVSDVEQEGATRYVDVLEPQVVRDTNGVAIATNMVRHTQSNFTDGVAKRRVVPQGEIKNQILRQDLEIQVGKDVIAKIMESRTNLAAIASLYGVSKEDLVALIVKNAPKLAFPRELPADTNQVAHGQLQTPRLGAGGHWVPAQPGPVGSGPAGYIFVEDADPNEAARLQLERQLKLERDIDAMRARYYGGKK